MKMTVFYGHFCVGENLWRKQTLFSLTQCIKVGYPIGVEDNCG